MDRPSKLTLAEARKQGKVDQFIAERESDEPGDLDAFQQTLSAMVRTSISEPETSLPDCDDD